MFDIGLLQTSVVTHASVAEPRFPSLGAILNRARGGAAEADLRLLQQAYTRCSMLDGIAQTVPSAFRAIC